MLKTAAESYTRRMYSEFEEEFRKQFTLSCELLQAAGQPVHSLLSIWNMKTGPLHALAVYLNA